MGPTILAKDLSATGLPVFSAGGSGAPWGYTEMPVDRFGPRTIILSARGSIGNPRLPMLSAFTSTQTTIAATCAVDVEPRYLTYVFRSLPWQEIASGAAIPMLTISRLAEQSVPLAPVGEQIRIADKLDTAFTRVDAVNTRLTRVTPILKRFRQSVLAAATSGRLTEDWRLYKAPLAWLLKRYGDICDFQNGYAFKSEIFRPAGDIQIIKLANVKDGKIKLDASPAFVSEQDVFDQLSEMPNVGDILISMTGTKYKRDYGFVCAVPAGPRLLVNQRVGRFVPDQSTINNKYLMFSLMSSGFRDQFFEGETGGVNQGNVGSTHIKSCTLLLPAIEEQAEIVRRVETLFAFADRLEARLQAAQTATERLTPALLAKAFRGELVPQDPNDEPASELLRRLQQEAPSTSTRRGRKSAA
jgi:type I restriction enzyme S subunit